ncbi:MAG TPA: XdhC family protein, partial [Novosphingobium sp.]|nr:XdhC family protein [Novosphingobium sp.]
VRRHVVPAHKAPPGMADARSAKPEAGAVLGEMLGALPRPVLLFGAGHVGQALERALAPLPFALHWFDTRPEFARPGVAIAGEDTLIAAITQAAPEAALLILTHDHGLDYRLASAALARPQGAPLFTGVIGSATKAARFRSRLGAQGLAAARLTCPIGLAGIGGKAPAVIAASVAAQLLMLESAPC